MDSEEFDLLVQQLYDSVLAPQSLPEALAALTRWLEGDTCHLVGFDGQSGAPLLSTSIGLDEGIGSEYVAHYAAIDPRRMVAAGNLKTGELLLCHEHFDARFVSRSEFFQDYLLPIGVHFTLASTLISDDTRKIQLAFHRYLGHEQFSPREADRLQRLIPHLQRAMTLMFRCHDLSQQSLLASNGLAASSFALIAVDGFSRLRYCNPAGEALLREAEVMHLHDGVLCLGKDGHKRGAEELASAIRETARSGRPLNLLLGKSKHRDQRYSLTLIRVASCATLPGLLADAVSDGVLCLVAPLDRRRIATARQLMELLDLTAAEARLARALASGESLEHYAKESGLRLPTAKSQLRSVFAKTACERQASLVRLIAAIPVVRDE